MPGAAGSGGYRRPGNPAPVSGPGAGSKRTDGGPAQKLRDLPDAQYGEAATFRDLQQQAPLAQTPSPRRPSQGSAGGGAGSATAGLFAPSAYPDQPETTPANRTMKSPLAQMEQEDLDRLKRYLPAFIHMAQQPDATPTFRNYVRVLRSRLR